MFSQVHKVIRMQCVSSDLDMNYDVAGAELAITTGNQTKERTALPTSTTASSVQSNDARAATAELRPGRPLSRAGLEPSSVTAPLASSALLPLPRFEGITLRTLLKEGHHEIPSRDERGMKKNRKEMYSVACY